MNYYADKLIDKKKIINSKLYIDEIADGRQI